MVYVVSRGGKSNCPARTRGSSPEGLSVGSEHAKLSVHDERTGLGLVVQCTQDV